MREEGRKVGRGGKEVERGGRTGRRERGCEGASEGASVGERERKLEGPGASLCLPVDIPTAPSVGQRTICQRRSRVPRRGVACSP
jgi:hypothetical protein